MKIEEQKSVDIVLGREHSELKAVKDVSRQQKMEKDTQQVKEKEMSRGKGIEIEIDF